MLGIRNSPPYTVRFSESNEECLMHGDSGVAGAVATLARPFGVKND